VHVRTSINRTHTDLQAIYQVLVMRHIDETNIFRIKGRFLTNGVKYFSFQSNNKAVSPGADPPAAAAAAAGFMNALLDTD
jgi:hypothetical protein